MKPRSYTLITATVFAIISLAHLIRIFQELPVQIGDCEIPVWWSWFGLAFTAFLSVSGFLISRRKE